MKGPEVNFKELWKPALIGVALSFLYATVLAKLGYDWWTDDNYSHGLLVPFVIIYIVWLKFDGLSAAERRPAAGVGIATIAFALLMLLFGTLAAELYMQRLSLVVMLAGVVVYFFGKNVLRKLSVPFLLVLFAIPIPQIIFNKIAFPLQLVASRLAGWIVGAVGIPSARQGNVLEITPAAGGKPILLEVVEACSGIRSLMTLLTLALVLGYLTSDRRKVIAVRISSFAASSDALRILILLLAALPIAVLTNAGRVAGTAVMTYYYGVEAAKGTVHESAGALVFVVALGMLIALNVLLKRYFDQNNGAPQDPHVNVGPRAVMSIPTSTARTVGVFLAILAGGVFVNWFEHRGEQVVPRRNLDELPSVMGVWKHQGGDMRFDQETEKVLRADDYVMRYYFSPETWLNFYAGYYGSQRSGATYHSPLNCLPGTGWELKDPKTIEIATPSGRSSTANRYTVQKSNNRQILIYWYQGRGRATASEYLDKVYTSIDSLTNRRPDGALVRIMVPIGVDEERSLESAVDFAGRVGDELSPFVPE